MNFVLCVRGCLTDGHGAGCEDGRVWIRLLGVATLATWLTAVQLAEIRFSGCKFRDSLGQEMFNANMSRDRKNKCRLGFTQAVEEFYDAVEDNVRSRLAVKDRFAKVENTFQAYKEACGAYAVRLESSGEVDARAKLAAECTRMESRYHDYVKAKETTSKVSLKFSVDRETADVTEAIEQLFLGTSATVEHPNYVENSGEKSDTEKKRISAELSISEKPEECRADMYRFPALHPMYLSL